MFKRIATALTALFVLYLAASNPVFATVLLGWTCYKIAQFVIDQIKD